MTIVRGTQLLCFLLCVSSVFLGAVDIKKRGDCQGGGGEDYTGTVNKTKSGLTCQKWTSDSPHTHKWRSMGDHNYCRNPDGEPGVWCYTTDPNTRFELCAVPVCDGCDYYDCSEGNLDMTQCCGNATNPSTEGFGCHGIDGGCCTDETRCKEGDGDCDKDLDCEGDLVCGNNNCPWGNGDDCCQKPGPNAPKKMRCDNTVFPKNVTCDAEKEKYCNISKDNTMCKYCGFNEEKCGGTCDYGITDQATIKIIVDRHNELRRKVAKGLEEGGREGKKGQPPAANMMEVEWDPEVAKMAQTWVNQCKWGHDSRSMESGYCGQNGGHAAGCCGSPRSGEEERKHLAKFVNMWYGEVNNIDSDCVGSFCKGNNTGTVGHYTQVVWAKVTKIGCGFRYYHKGGWSGTYVFCNYCPGGNMVGSPIYKVGEPGSDCPDGSTNVDGLCQVDKVG